ncbi:MAG: hypothetical protein JSU00_19325 [Acidobacteria bacterium]|nr:hypothetical protein [Acidobacteriota bacterium]
MSYKSKVISVRLSDEEYREIKTHCVDLGEVNISEFARAAMAQVMSSRNNQSATSMIELKMAALQQRLDRLEERVDRIVAMEASA